MSSLSLTKSVKFNADVATFLGLLRYCFINFGVIFAVFGNMENSRNSNKQCALKFLASQAGLCTITNNLQNDSSKEFILSFTYIW